MKELTLELNDENQLPDPNIYLDSGECNNLIIKYLDHINYDKLHEMISLWCDKVSVDGHIEIHGTDLYVLSYDLITKHIDYKIYHENCPAITDINTVSQILQGLKFKPLI